MAMAKEQVSAAPFLDKSKMTPEELKKDVTRQRDRDREKVRGIFKFYEVPGGSMSFSYKAYKGDKVERYDMVDGEVYEIPRGVARHLNKNGWYPEYEFTPGDAGMQSAHNAFTGHGMKIGKKVARFGFQSLEFIDDEDVQSRTSSILMVERV